MIKTYSLPIPAKESDKVKFAYEWLNKVLEFSASKYKASDYSIQEDPETIMDWVVFTLNEDPDEVKLLKREIEELKEDIAKYTKPKSNQEQKHGILKSSNHR